MLESGSGRGQSLNGGPGAEAKRWVARGEKHPAARFRQALEEYSPARFGGFQGSHEGGVPPGSSARGMPWAGNSRQPTSAA